MLSHMFSNLGIIQLTLPNKLLEEYNTHQEIVHGEKKKSSVEVRFQCLQMGNFT